MSEFTLSNLRIARGSRRTPKRVGRGSGSGRGSYSGRGIKGQKARSGGKKGLTRRALKIQLQSKPKFSGFKSMYSKMATVDLDMLNSHFEAGEIVTPKRLLTKGLVETVRHGVKVLGSGMLQKKLGITADAFSESAKRAIMEAGGTAQVIVRTRRKSTVEKRN